MKRVLSILVILIATLTIFPSVSLAGEKYVNPRFGFSIELPDKWAPFRDPAPQNNDGVSFTLPGDARFSASGSHNVLERSLKDSVDEWIAGNPIIRSTPITLSNGKGEYVRWNDQDQNHMLLFVMSRDKDICFTVYYRGPENSFPLYSTEAFQALKTFEIINSQH